MKFKWSSIDAYLYTQHIFLRLTVLNLPVIGYLVGAFKILPIFSTFAKEDHDFVFSKNESVNLVK